jgi:hypothetical protein
MPELEATFSEALAKYGFVTPLRCAFDDIGSVVDSADRPVFVVDVNRERKDDEVAGICALLAGACNQMDAAPQTSPPPIDIADDMKANVDAICDKYRYAAMMIAEELLDTGLPEHICTNIAVFNVINQAARLAVMSAHAFEKREPRRDWWAASTLAHFDDAVRWFAETLGKAISKKDDGEPEDVTRCIACDEIIQDGDLVYIENGEGGFIHAGCCGPERESYLDADGNPLKDGDPIPEPFPFGEKSTNG